MKFPTIGIVGGGQLGRMLALAAYRLGMKVAVLDPNPEAPAAQVAMRRVVGEFRDVARLQELAEGCDVVTVDTEHVNADALAVLEAAGIAVQPPVATIRLIQDKLTQKTHLAANNLPLPPFRDTPDLAAINAAVDALGFPLMLKARRHAYDGRSNALIVSREDIQDALSRLGSTGLYAEGWVPFAKELVVLVARAGDGTLLDYPAIEIIGRDGANQTAIAPAQITPTAAATVRDVARRAVSALTGAGVFAVELFLQASGEVVLNEVAPRVHSAGHFTIEACVTDQFEQHLRAISGLPLGDVALRVAAAGTVHALGGETLDDSLKLIDNALTLPGASVHWYGKGEARPRRKMGHVTVTANSIAELMGRLSSLSAVTTPSTSETKVVSVAQVGVLVGSEESLSTMRAAADVLREFGVPFEVTLISAHRTPSRMLDYARSAHTRGLKVIIAGATGAAHLPGMIATLTPLPVIGVPIATESLRGLDSLYSMVQMPLGTPVATVAIGGAGNAALLAVRLLAANNPELQRKLITYQATLEASLTERAAALARDGWEWIGQDSGSAEPSAPASETPIIPPQMSPASDNAPEPPTGTA